MMAGLLTRYHFKTGGEISVTNRENSCHEARGIWVDGETFARYAEADLDRWRQLIGRQVQHKDARWGMGTVDDVIWGAPVERVSEYVQVRVSYQAGWTVDFNSQTWHLHHQRALVDPAIGDVICRCLDPARSHEEQSECLAQHSRALREAMDREALARRSARQE